MPFPIIKMTAIILLMAVFLFGAVFGALAIDILITIILGVIIRVIVHENAQSVSRP